jgi:hypothetical protein
MKSAAQYRYGRLLRAKSFELKSAHHTAKERQKPAIAIQRRKEEKIYSLVTSFSLRGLHSFALN